MEVILNFLWLSVAVGAFGLWRARKLRGQGKRPAQWELIPEVLALGCALILLFPSISLTDDLHAAQAIMEESSRPTVKAWKATQGSLRAGKVISPFVAVVHGGFPQVARLAVGKVATQGVCLSKSVSASPSQSRSPPFHRG